MPENLNRKTDRQPKTKRENSSSVIINEEPTAGITEEIPSKVKMVKTVLQVKAWILITVVTFLVIGFAQRPQSISVGAFIGYSLAAIAEIIVNFVTVQGIMNKRKWANTLSYILAILNCLGGLTIVFGILMLIGLGSKQTYDWFEEEKIKPDIKKGYFQNKKQESAGTIKKLPRSSAEKVVGILNIIIIIFLFILTFTFIFMLFAIIVSFFLVERQEFFKSLTNVGYNLWNSLFVPFFIYGIVKFFRKAKNKYNYTLILLLIMWLGGQVYRFFFITNHRLMFDDLSNLLFLGIPFILVCVAKYLDKKRKPITQNIKVIALFIGLLVIISGVIGGIIWFNKSAPKSETQNLTHLVYELNFSNSDNKNQDDIINTTKLVIDKRIKAFGIKDYKIYTESNNNKKRIVIDLPKVNNVDEVNDLVEKTARLEFKEQVVAPQKDSNGNENLATIQWQLTGLIGAQLKNAQVNFNKKTNEPEIKIEFNSEGAILFGEITKRNIGERLAIFLDNKLISAPTVQTAITDGDAVITGKFTVDEAKQLVIQLNAGTLPLQLKLIEKTNK